MLWSAPGSGFGCSSLEDGMETLCAIIWNYTYQWNLCNKWIINGRTCNQLDNKADYPRTLSRGGIYWEIHGSRIERFPKRLRFAIHLHPGGKYAPIIFREWTPIITALKIIFGQMTDFGFFFLWYLPPGHLPLATWSARTIGKRGIPEKSFQNLAQLRWNRTLQSKVMAENRFLGNRPLYFTL